jgi:hypothetical protein
MGKIVSVYEHFGLRTFRFTNGLQERIKFVNRGPTVQAKVKYKTIPLQALTGPEGSRRLRLPDFKTIGTSRL